MIEYKEGLCLMKSSIFSEISIKIAISENNPKANTKVDKNLRMMYQSSSFIGLQSGVDGAQYRFFPSHKVTFNNMLPGFFYQP